MATKNKCPYCGKPVPTTALQGICPECLLRVGAAADTAEVGPGGTVIAKPPPPPTLRVAELAPHFPQLEILECLGRGGMGAVYKARQPRLDRFVALKILARDRDNGKPDAEFTQRFEREARALARLSHPDIVAVYDYGEAGGFHYLLMEYVDGLTLRQLLQTRKLSPEEALAIVPKICGALQFAHERGIVHRDIKPENILLDKEGRVKIADFGIAKIVGQPSGASLTQEKQVIGTPHYMAPEQVEKPATVDHRADIFSLGVVFYEMLTGELPLGKFQPPSRKVQMDVRLDEVVLHALEKEPDRRYQHASEVKTDVETIVNSAGASVQPAEPVTAASAPRNDLRFLDFTIGMPQIVAGEGRWHFYWPGVLLFCSTIGFAVCGVNLAIGLGLWLLNVTLPHGNTFINPGEVWLWLVWLAFCAIGRLAALSLGADKVVRASVSTSRSVRVLLVLAASAVWAYGLTHFAGWLRRTSTDVFAVSSSPGNSARGAVWVVISVALVLFIFRRYLRGESRSVAPAKVLNPLPAVKCPLTMEAWLAIVDAGNYAQSWDGAAPDLQSTVGKAEWVRQLDKIRRPLGKLVARKLASTTEVTATSAQFEASYDTSFDNLPRAVETVTYALLPNGEWRASGYLVKPAGGGLCPAPTAAPTSKWVPLARWTARILGALLFAFFAVFILAEGLPPIASQPEGVQLNFVALGLMLAGFAVGWKREGTAALLIASGWTLWQISENRIEWNLFQTPVPVAALYGYCWWATRGRRTGVLCGAVAALAVALGLGRLFCPTSVFLSGTVTDGASGQPIADARLGLEQRASGSIDLANHPNARTDSRGRFKLYVGWYAEGKRLAVFAPGYPTLETNLAPRALGQRNVSQDFQLQPVKHANPVAFGPVIERVLNGSGEEMGFQGLNLESGNLLSATAKELSNDDLRKGWMAEHGVDLLAVNRGGFKWKLGGPDFKVARLSEGQWNQASPEELRRGLDAVVMETEDGWPFHAINDRLEKPLTFALQTGAGTIGLLQITGFTDKPAGVKLRYKLAAKPDGELAAWRAKLASGEIPVRREAGFAIHALESPPHELRPKLIRLLEKDPDGIMRIIAAVTLGRLGTNAGPEVVAALGAALTDRDRRVRHDAAEALARVDPDSKAIVLIFMRALTNRPSGEDYLRVQADSQRRNAVLMLGKIGSPAAVALPALRLLVEDAELALDVEEAILAIDPTTKTAGKMATRGNVPLSGTFGPVIERVIPDFESLEPPQVLRLLTGDVIPVPVEIFKRDDPTAARDWATTNRVLASINFGGDSRALNSYGWKFGDVPEAVWAQATPADIEAALAAGTKVLETTRLDNGSLAHEISANVHLPLNCAFRTRLGDRGLMQIVEISRQPRTIKIRYKLVSDEPATKAVPNSAPPLFAQVPPVVISTTPVSGASDVDPALTELRVTFSKPMQDGSWSWTIWGEENFPEQTGQPRFLADGRTCVLPVKLKPGKLYATWLNSDYHQNFKDRAGQSAVPYLLIFETRK